MFTSRVSTPPSIPSLLAGKIAPLEPRGRWRERRPHGRRPIDHRRSTLDDRPSKIDPRPLILDARLLTAGYTRGEREERKRPRSRTSSPNARARRKPRPTSHGDTQPVYSARALAADLPNHPVKLVVNHTEQRNRDFPLPSFPSLPVSASAARHCSKTRTRACLRRSQGCVPARSRRHSSAIHGTPSTCARGSRRGSGGRTVTIRPSRGPASGERSARGGRGERRTPRTASEAPSFESSRPELNGI